MNKADNSTIDSSKVFDITSMEFLPSKLNKKKVFSRAYQDIVDLIEENQDQDNSEASSEAVSEHKQVEEKLNQALLELTETYDLSDIPKLLTKTDFEYLYYRYIENKIRAQNDNFDFGEQLISTVEFLINLEKQRLEKLAG